MVNPQQAIDGDINTASTLNAGVGVTVTLNPRPAKAGFVADDLTVCAGSSATIEISNPENNVIYDWFTTPTGGNAVFTSIKYTTPAIT